MSEDKIIPPTSCIVTMMLVTYTLGGCTSTQQPSQAELANSDHQRTIAQCKERYPSDSKTVVARVKCFANADITYKALWKSPDIVQFMDSERLLAAENFQNGKLSKSEYEREMARINVQGTNIEHARINSAISSQAQAQSADAASVASDAMMMQTFQQQNHINQMRSQQISNQNMHIFSNGPITTNCYSYGNNVNCTSR